MDEKPMGQFLGKELLRRISFQVVGVHFKVNFILYWNKGFPCSSVVKESAHRAGGRGSIPELGRSPGEGTGNPLQYPCLENLMDRGAWWAAVHGVAKSWARLSD